MFISKTAAYAIVQEIKEITGHNINIMDENGVIFASTDPERMGQRHQGACQVLAAQSIHGKSGARDLRNNIRRMVEDRIASLLVERGEGAVTAVAVTGREGQLSVAVL